MLRPALDRAKGDKEARGGREVCEARGGEEAVLASDVERLDEQGEPKRHRERPGQVETANRPGGASFGKQPPRRGDRHEADRDVEEEDPLPAEAVGEGAAQNRSGRSPRRTDGGPRAERAVALAAFGVQRGQQRQRRRRGDRRTETLRRARGQ
jgi:hypothetical protein